MNYEQINTITKNLQIDLDNLAQKNTLSYKDSFTCYCAYSSRRNSWYINIELSSSGYFTNKYALNCTTKDLFFKDNTTFKFPERYSDALDKAKAKLRTLTNTTDE